MKTGSEENNQHLESETSFKYSIITEMQEFIEDLTDFLSYALVAKDYKNNPSVVLSSIDKIINRTICLKEIYIESLQTESEEELESREEAIFDEIDTLNDEMRYYEILLDSYLVFHDDGPPLRLQFGNHALIISASTDC